MPPSIDRTPRGDATEWLLPVWVQPGARKNAVVGVLDGRLKIRIAARAMENKANAAVTVFVAEQLGLRRNQVELAVGATGRRKMLRIIAEREPDWERLAPTGKERRNTDELMKE